MSSQSCAGTIYISLRLYNTNNAVKDEAWPLPVQKKKRTSQSIPINTFSDPLETNPVHLVTGQQILFTTECAAHALNIAIPITTNNLRHAKASPIIK